MATTSLFVEIIVIGALADEHARARVFQEGSSEFLQDLILDRHIIRIARSNVFNFVLIAVALTLNGRHLTGSALSILVLGCLAVASLSFAQWRFRYASYYKKIAVAVEVFNRGDAPPNYALKPTGTASRV